MGQTWFLEDCPARGRWRPVTPPFRLPPLARIARWKPLPGQLFLPGMGPDEDSGGLSLTFDENICDSDRKRANGAGPAKAMCPNCGGVEFDEDGDCTSCWEPAVVPPNGGRNRTACSSR
jgi:hypothetical protein